MAMADLLEHLIALLRTLSEDVVATRLEPNPSSPFDPTPFLSSSAPLFAALHAVNRNSLLFTKGCKARTQDARLEMDSAHLRLQVSWVGGAVVSARQDAGADSLSVAGQNLLFKRNHLEREIRKCEEFE